MENDWMKEADGSWNVDAIDLEWHVKFIIDSRGVPDNHPDFVYFHQVMNAHPTFAKILLKLMPRLINFAKKAAPA